MIETTPPPRPESRWQIWTDASGREYRIRLTVGLIGRVRRDTGVSLGDALAGKFAEILFDGPEKIAQVLYAVSQPVTGTVTPEEFAESLDGSAVEDAVVALLGAVADFRGQARSADAVRSSFARILAAVDDATVRSMSIVANNGKVP